MLNENPSNIAWLNHLYYEIGKQRINFRIAHSYRDKTTNELKVSKWTPFLGATEQQIDKADQRTLLDNEIVFDMDEGDYDQLIKQLTDDGIFFTAYKTEGNRARHVHSFWKDLEKFEIAERRQFRVCQLQKYGCDLQLAIDNHLIPIENSLHWKTGEIKKMYYENTGINDIKKYEKEFEEYKENLEKEKYGKNIDTDKEEITKLLSRPKKEYKCLGIGIHNNIFYFGTVLDDNNKQFSAIITSDKKIYRNHLVEGGENGHKYLVNDIKREFGMDYRFDLFADCIDYSWSNKSIMDYLYYSPQIMSIKELFITIKDKNKSHIYHVDERTHTFIACDIISNYFYPIFNAKGRTYIQAEFGSGKSEQSNIYRLLSFNPLLGGSISPASFERVIESTGGTIIIDNFDNISEEVKPLIYQAIEVYYKKGSKSIKAAGKDNKPMAFNGFSPLVINNILGLPEVTESRCFKIMMLRTDTALLKLEKINDNDPFWDTMRDQLHLSALTNWKEVKYAYKTLKVDELNNRNLEIVEAVLTIAKCVGDEEYEELLSYILETFEQQNIKEISDNWDYLLFKELHETISENETKSIKSRDIADKLYPLIFEDGDKNKKQHITKLTRYIGKTLSNLKLFKKGLKDGLAYYEIKRVDLDRIIKIKHYHKYLFADKININNTLDAFNPINTSNSLDTTNTLNTLDNTNNYNNIIINNSVLSGLSNSSNNNSDADITNSNEPVTNINIRQAILKLFELSEKITYNQIEIILKCEDKTPYEPLDKTLENMIKKGEIYSPKPGEYYRI